MQTHTQCCTHRSSSLPRRAPGYAESLSTCQLAYSTDRRFAEQRDAADTDRLEARRSPVQVGIEDIAAGKFRVITLGRAG